MAAAVTVILWRRRKFLSARTILILPSSAIRGLPVHLWLIVPARLSRSVRMINAAVAKTFRLCSWTAGTLTRVMRGVIVSLG